MDKEPIIKLFTSESVTEGHPDKICDAISDAILDEVLCSDPEARVACDCAVNTGLVLVLGELTTESYVDIPKIVRGVVREIGYTDAKFGFDADSCAVLTSIDEQSPDISQGVTRAADYSGDKYDLTGAGDQGMMFGFACRDTAELMPLPITLAHALTKELAARRKNGVLPYLRPDGKAQVTVAYQNGVPAYVDTVVIAAQHSEEIDMSVLRADITKMLKEVIPQKYLRPNTKIHINETGRFVIGGPAGDSGLTGRKIICDTYGGFAPHGGGAFSGKDPTKVDRSACYMARYACKNIVAANLADKVLLEVSYAIGCARPVSFYIDTYGTGKYSDAEILKAVNKVFDMRPAAIIDALGLKKPIYRATSNYGHFGNPFFPWEKTDKVEALLKAIK